MQLIITIDYELFGDGSGDVFDTMIHPTEEFLYLCKKHQIKSTIFFEVIEYLKLKEEWERGNKMGYSNNPAMAIEEQILKAYKEGHDIQLHIHPQWINAIYKNREWILDNRYWKLPNVPGEADADFPIGLDALIKLSKKAIESIIKPIDPGYETNIFRAGGFNIYPSHRIIPVLRENGFIADSSVFAGAYEESERSHFDYRNISNDLPYWWVKDSVIQPATKPQDFLEIPVFAISMRRIRKYDLNRIKIALRNKKSNMEKFKGKVSKESGGVLQKVLYFLQKEAITWDYCLFSSRKMNRYLKVAKTMKAASQRKFHPFVLVGHSKEFILPETFEKFIQKNKQELNFLTLKEAVSKIQKLQD